MSILKHKFPPGLHNLYDEKLANQLANTGGAISALNQIRHILHNPTLLMRPILGKEAESSAQLEGTQASIEDAYKLDVGGQSEEERNQALEIRNYQDAMLGAWDTTTKSGLTESIIRQAQNVLTKDTRGKKKHPGEYRSGDVWIGDLGTLKEEARYVAPEAAYVPTLMSELMKFISDSGTLHPLISCAVIHHRFEAIHPFEDGNGRTGRLLITLYLVDQGVLEIPILYPSGFFEKNRKQYINNLSNVDQNEDWKPWIIFFLRGMEKQAKLANSLALEINKLYKESRNVIENEKASLHLIRVLEFTFQKPYLTAPLINHELSIPKVTTSRYLKTLVDKDILEYITNIGQKKVYANIKLLEILRKI